MARSKSWQKGAEGSSSASFLSDLQQREGKWWRNEREPETSDIEPLPHSVFAMSTWTQVSNRLAQRNKHSSVNTKD
jgi:hypothetical protein